MSWGICARAALRFAAILEDLRVGPLGVDGYFDNDSLRLAVQRGTNSKMGHLRKTASLNFRLLKQIGMVPLRVAGTRNIADVLTKILGRERARYILRRFFGLDVPDPTVHAYLNLVEGSADRCRMICDHGDPACVLVGITDIAHEPELTNEMVQFFKACSCRGDLDFELDY